VKPGEHALHYPFAGPVHAEQPVKQGEHELSEDYQVYPDVHTLLHSFPLVKAKDGVLQTEH
jgi:hypothetical protein